MTTASGSRKWLTIALCLAPALLAFTFFNIYPILYNIQISFTDTNRLNFANPANIRNIGGRNYDQLIASLFRSDALNAMLALLLIFLPLIVCSVLVRRIRAQDRFMPPDTSPYWVGALALTVVLWSVLDGSGQINTLERTGDFFIVVFRSVLYVFACIPLIFLIAIGLALILNNPDIRFKTLWRTLIILPWIVPFYIAALIWQFFFRTEAGTVNQILRLLGVENPPAWYASPALAFFVIVVVQVWFTYPFAMSIILGALQAIPSDMYEAAEVDGASWITQLFKITLPLLRPAVVPILIMTSLSTFLISESVFLITGGLPSLGAGRPGATDLVMVYAYRQVFQQGAYGKAAAFAVILFPFLIIATLFIFRATSATRGAYD